jgi:hypothetical protein
VLNNISKKIIVVLKYILVLGILGFVFSFLIKWPIYKGIYIFILVPGVLLIAYSGINFVGIPKERFEFFSGKMHENNKNKPKNERKSLGDGGWIPALLGVIMIAIALIIEAVFRNM